MGSKLGLGLLPSARSRPSKYRGIVQQWHCGHRLPWRGPASAAQRLGDRTDVLHRPQNEHVGEYSMCIVSTSDNLYDRFPPTRLDLKKERCKTGAASPTRSWPPNLRNHDVWSGLVELMRWQMPAFQYQRDSGRGWITTRPMGSRTLRAAPNGKRSGLHRISAVNAAVRQIRRVQASMVSGLECSGVRRPW